MKSKFLNLAFPILLIRDRPLILVPDCLIDGVSRNGEVWDLSEIGKVFN